MIVRGHMQSKLTATDSPTTLDTQLMNGLQSYRVKREKLAYYFTLPPGDVDLGEDLVDLLLLDGILLQLCLCQDRQVSGVFLGSDTVDDKDLQGGEADLNVCF